MARRPITASVHGLVRGLMFPNRLKEARDSENGVNPTGLFGPTPSSTYLTGVVGTEVALMIG